MSNIRNIIWLLTITGTMIAMGSCTTVQTKNNENQEKSISDSNKTSLSGKESVVYLLPSPGEILLRFYSSDVQFMPELLTSPKNKDKYIGSKAQALNLGVYITDMAYSALFERSTETVNYLEAIQSLSVEAGISSNIFESLLTRSKANAGQLDSLVNISNEAFTEMLEFLETGGKEVTIAQISAGAYIESLYLALQSIEKYSEDNEAIKMLMEMKYPMDNLVENAKTAVPSESDQSILNYLNQISGIFNELDKTSAKTVVSETKTGEITISGGKEFVMNETNFNKLKIKVSEVRNNIVSF
jgi:hypothetical protein